MSSSEDETSFPVAKNEAQAAIRELIIKEGLNTLTSSKIRTYLKNTFNKDFDGFKKDVDNLTKAAIAESNSGKNEQKANTSSVSTTDGRKDKDTDSDSSDDEIISDERARPAKKNKAAKRKKSNEDEEGMDLHSAVKQRRRAAASKAEAAFPKTIGSRNKKAKDKDGKPKDLSGKFGTMTKLCLISPELQVILKRKYMKRCDVIKEMWAYIRKEELFDPKDKRFAIVNDALMPVFKTKRFRVFSMSKNLSKHIKDPAHLGGEILEEALAEQSRLTALWKARQLAEENGEKLSKDEAESDAEEEDNQEEEDEEDNTASAVEPDNYVSDSD